MDTKVLIVNRENRLFEFIKGSLDGEKALVRRARTTHQAQTLIGKEDFDLIIVDADGDREYLRSLFRMLKSPTSNSPEVVVLTGSEKPSIDGIPRDGVVVSAKTSISPDFIKGMLARVRQIRKNLQARQCRVYYFSDVVVDTVTRCVYKGGREVYLRAKEYKLLLHLLRNPGKVFTREDLKAQVWGEACPSDVKTVDVTLSSLRKKVEGKDERDKHLVTVRNEGYTFRY